jgi:hypothetical protein
VGAEFGGSVLVQAVNTLEGLLDAQARPGTVLFLHYVAEALKFAFANRMLLGDPAFEPQVVAIIAKMIDPEHAASLRARISPTHTFPVVNPQKQETASFCCSFLLFARITTRIWATCRPRRSRQALRTSGEEELLLVWNSMCSLSENTQYKCLFSLCFSQCLFVLY